MSQYTFNKSNVKMILEFIVEDEFGESHEKEIEVNSFCEFHKTINEYYGENFSSLFGYSPVEVELTGIRFNMKEGSQRLSVDFGESFHRATMIFDENEFVAIKEDKLKRIKSILME